MKKRKQIRRRTSGARVGGAIPCVARERSQGKEARVLLGTQDCPSNHHRSFSWLPVAPIWRACSRPDWASVLHHSVLELLSYISSHIHIPARAHDADEREAVEDVPLSSYFMARSAGDLPMELIL
uniref:Uncharacterized protein n=1 Tax=Ananas comosus var. bracteatus TaxID=296719 RepID=A0A6V7P1V9_ANACO|nr:unnamed protein product [Ananas comosus var. bracteatus]